jgi:hypothetical protein
MQLVITGDSVKGSGQEFHSIQFVLFICGLFNNAVGNSRVYKPDDRFINE